MTAIYDFYKNPKQKDSTEKTRYHARVVTNQTISTDELARKIHTRGTVTTADVKAVLTSLSDVIVEACIHRRTRLSADHAHVS